MLAREVMAGLTILTNALLGGHRGHRELRHWPPGGQGGLQYYWPGGPRVFLISSAALYRVQVLYFNISSKQARSSCNCCKLHTALDHFPVRDSDGARKYWSYWNTECKTDSWSCQVFINSNQNQNEIYFLALGTKWKESCVFLVLCCLLHNICTY